MEQIQLRKVKKVNEMSIFDKWDKNVDTEGLQKDIAEAEANK